MSNADTPLEIDVQSVKQLLDEQADFVLLDCREEDEYAKCKIDGARLLPMSQLAERVAELEPARGKKLVIHCHHGGRSLRVARWLREQGFATSQSMAGGIDAWSLQIDSTVPRY